MDREISSTMSSLFKTDKCSPLVVYIVLVIVTGVTLFNTNGLMKKLQNFKINNIFTMHMWYEISMLIVLGVVLFGLCQYNQQTLAWIVLFFPIALYIVKTLFVFNSVSSILRHVPPDVPAHLVGGGAPGVPNPVQGPAPPKISGHYGETTPTQQQTEGVRQALDERRSNISGQNSQMMQNLTPDSMNPPLTLGGSPF